MNGGSEMNDREILNIVLLQLLVYLVLYFLLLLF